MARTDNADHVQVVELDQAIEMDVEEIQSRCGAPMTQQARFEMVQPKRNLEQRIVLQINLANGQIVCRSPIGVHLFKKFRRQRVWHCNLRAGPLFVGRDRTPLRERPRLPFAAIQDFRPTRMRRGDANPVGRTFIHLIENRCLKPRATDIDRQVPWDVLGRRRAIGNSDLHLSMTSTPAGRPTTILDARPTKRPLSTTPTMAERRASSAAGSGISAMMQSMM